MKKRNVAYKVWISQLFNGKYVKREDETSYIELDGKSISRVNMIVSVVAKYASDDGNYMALTIDDGSDEIRLKSWGEDTRLLKNINKGDVVIVIGKARKYNEEIYITPEIVKPVNDLNWETARKLELLKEHGFVKRNDNIINETAGLEEKPYTKEKEYVEERIEDTASSNEARQKVLDMINKLNSSEGVRINEIARQTGLSENEINSLIGELLKDGEIYQSKAGFVNLV